MNCAFLMSSCDAYEDLWEPFFECLDEMVGEEKVSVYLNTEHKVFVPKKKLRIEVKTINQTSQKNLTWSRRFIDVLNRIPEDYVFLVLDDFFCCAPIDMSYFHKIIEKMEEDKKIASFQFFGTRVRNKNPSAYLLKEEYSCYEMDENGWKTHFVPTIWRKSVLKKWLRPWESIWAFEECGSQRARRWKYPEKVMVVDKPPVYDYLWIDDCSAVINGKWLAEPELLSFFEKHKINVDWSKRGRMTVQEYRNITMKDIIKRLTMKEIIIKSFNRIRSFF